MVNDFCVYLSVKDYNIRIYLLFFFLCFNYISVYSLLSLYYEKSLINNIYSVRCIVITLLLFFCCLRAKSVLKRFSSIPYV